MDACITACGALLNLSEGCRCCADQVTCCCNVACAAMVCVGHAHHKVRFIKRRCILQHRLCASHLSSSGANAIRILRGFLHIE